MAPGAQVSGETAVEIVPPPAAAAQFSPKTDTANVNSNGVKDSDSNSKSESQMKNIVKMLSKLNPMAKEFLPLSYNCDQSAVDNSVPADNNSGNNGYRNNRRRRNNHYQGRRQLNRRASRAQREYSIKRTVYASDIDHNITEEQLAVLFSGYGQVVDCRVCGDPNSRLRFAFVEFADEHCARAALNLCGAMVGFYSLRVKPSKTAILPVNPTFLPKSNDEREMCARTIYCTNIDKRVSQAEVKSFFATRCGEVTRLRLLGDQVHSTHIAFVEFAAAESANWALDCCGGLLGSERIRVSPSKTPLRPGFPRSASIN